MKLRVVLLLVLLASIFAVDAVACGDSLYRVGKGVSYRVYTAPLPGNVLVYGDAEGTEQLAEALAQSGHSVRLVNNEQELTAELESGSYDVVIAPFNEHETVEANTRNALDQNTTFLPVAFNDDEEKIAQKTYSSVMVAEKDEIKNYLKAIHKSLKRKS